MNNNRTLTDEEAQLLKERNDKITQFEKFIDEKLKVDLQKVLEQRDKIYDDIAKYLELKNKILLIKDNKLEEMKTMINMGSSFYMEAHVPDTSRIYVDVGLGFHVEFTLDEAIQFIDKKEKVLTSQTEVYTNQAAQIKTRIKLMYEGIAQLMNLPFNE